MCRASRAWWPLRRAISRCCPASTGSRPSRESRASVTCGRSSDFMPAAASSVCGSGRPGWEATRSGACLRPARRSGPTTWGFRCCVSRGWNRPKTICVWPFPGSTWSMERRYTISSPTCRTPTASRRRRGLCRQRTGAPAGGRFQRPGRPTAVCHAGGGAHA